MHEKKLLLLLQKKKSFFETILELTQTEASLPVNELINVLEQKTVLLACIEEVDEELQHFKLALSNMTQETQEEMDKIKMLIDTIMRLNGENMKQRKLQYKLYRPK